MKILKILAFSLLIAVPSFTIQSVGTWHTLKAKAASCALIALNCAAAKTAYKAYLVYRSLPGTDYIPYTDLIGQLPISLTLGIGTGILAVATIMHCKRKKTQEVTP